MPASDDRFQQLALHADDATEMLERLAERCLAERDWGTLFEARLMQARRRLGLPIDCRLLSDQSAEVRDQLEQAYHAACVEAADGMIAADRLVDAWPYLRAAGEQQRMADALAAVRPTDQTAEELIQLALHEGVNPAVGFRWLLDHYGTCNAVTTLDGLAGYFEPDELRPCAEILVGWMHRELTESVAAHIEREEGQRPVGKFTDWLPTRPWLFEHELSHVDASHLGSTVRLSRLLTEPAIVRLALDLAEYGARLHESQRFPQPPPFEDVYTAHALWLHAALGEQADQAAAYFRGQVDSHPDEYSRPACVEAYVDLLSRIGRESQALGELDELVAADEPLPSGVPTPLELARASGDWPAYDRLVQSRGDAVGYAAGLIARREAP
ncbi:hypothetical protein [Posidoniimonas polymericola]|uniref:hypothetical protein n=1 Tax=Posidoniimonas polymericola TaxID=2528002 RepID=UPI0011B36026|nr:hypothetical protein [Posidoniimonas polymericola]